MTALTSSILRAEKPGPDFRKSHPVANGVTTYAGAVAALAGAAAAANQGFALGYDNLAGLLPLGGFWSDEVVGDGSKENNAHMAGRIAEVTVTGTTNNATDLGKVIFADSDGEPFLLADPGNSLPLGVILSVPSAGKAVVYFFSFEALCVLGILAQSAFNGAAGEWTSWGTRAGNP